MKRLTVILFALSLFASLPVAAQRTVSGTSIIEAGISAPASTSIKGIGATIVYGQYVLDGFWDAGVIMDSCVKTTESLSEYDVVHFLGEFERQWRVLSTWNRVFNIYGGLGLFLGAELIDPRGTLRAGERIEGSTFGFLYGAHAALSAEFYLFPYFSISLTGRPMAYGGSRYGWFSAPVTLGLRLSF